MIQIPHRRSGGLGKTTRIGRDIGKVVAEIPVQGCTIGAVVEGNRRGRREVVNGRRDIGGIRFGLWLVTGTGRLVQSRWRTLGSRYGSVRSLAERSLGCLAHWGLSLRFVFVRGVFLCIFRNFHQPAAAEGTRRGGDRT